MSEGDQLDPSKQERLREHPEMRFAPSQHAFDLQAVAEELASERAAGSTGHRQKTLYRSGRMTVALFRFEAGAVLKDHSAAGTVTIHVVEGRMRVRTPESEHALAAGRLLVLASNVRHEVEADEASTMLLQVHLDEGARA